MSTIADSLARILRGHRFPATHAILQDADAFCAAAEEHGILPLVAYELAHTQDVPAALSARLRVEAARAAVVELVREAELRRLLTDFDNAAVRVLITKGAQLAYSHYPQSELRPRADTDLLIRETDRDAADRVLTSSGYEPSTQAGGDLLMYQQPYVLRRHGAIAHAVDLHWRMTNPQVFADVITYDVAAGRAISLPQLHPAARALSDIDALLLACVHRVAHHHDADYLIWLYDIHLLASGLRADDWPLLTRLAVERQVSAICRHSLECTVARFATNVPPAVWLDLGSQVTWVHERSASYLRRRRHIANIADDLRALGSVRARLRLLRQHVLPPVRYMREVYAPASATPLAVLYVRRAFIGAKRWLARA